MSASAKIGSVIRELRKRGGLTQEELAQRTDRSVDAISQIERGVNSPNIETLLRLAAALDVPLDAFFKGLTNEDDKRHTALISAFAVLCKLSDRDLQIATLQLQVFLDA